MVCLEMLTLESVKESGTVVVVDIESKGWARRLYHMGILPGVELEVVYNRGKGPVIVRCHGVEVAIGRGIARRILVKVAEK